MAPKSIDRYKAKARELWDARQSLTSKQLVTQWRQYSLGWWNYIKLATRVGISDNGKAGRVVIFVNVSGYAGITRKAGLTRYVDEVLRDNNKKPQAVHAVLGE